MIDRASPSCCGAIHLAGPSPSPPTPLLLLRLVLRCCYCCAAVVVLRLLLVFSAFISKNQELAFVVCCGGDHDRGDRAWPSCCVAIHLAGPATATSAAAVAPGAAAAVLLLLCCCFCAAVLTLSYACSNSVLLLLLRSGDRCCCAWILLHTLQDGTFLCFKICVYFCGIFFAKSAECMPE